MDLVSLTENRINSRSAFKERGASFVLRLFDKEKLKRSAVDLGSTPGTCHRISPSLIILDTAWGTNLFSM
jgi:hypothetical protein